MIVVWQNIPETTDIYRLDVPQPIVDAINKSAAPYIGLEGAPESELMELSDLLESAGEKLQGNLIPLHEADRHLLICGQVM